MATKTTTTNMRKYLDHNLVIVLPIVLFALTVLTFFITRSNSVIQIIESQQIQQFDGYKEPRGLSLTPSGSLLVTDFRNYRIQEIALSGDIFNEWGEQGKEPGQFNDPTCAAMDDQGNLYIVDTWNHRVQKYTKDGQWIGNWAKFNRFFAPRGIAIDRQNRVYVANTSKHTLVIFDAFGNHIATWGQKGKGLSQFHDPVGVAIGPHGNIYVADTGNRRIKVLSPEGTTVDSIPIKEWKSHTFQEAYIAVGENGEIYITVPLKNTVQIYYPRSKSYLRFGHNDHNQLDYPTGIAVDQARYIYVSDTVNNRVVKYAPIQYTFPLPAPSRSFMSTKMLIILFICISTLLIYMFWSHKKQSDRYMTCFLRDLLQLFSPLSRMIKRFHTNPHLQRILELGPSLKVTSNCSLYVIASFFVICSILLFTYHKPGLGSGFLLFSIILFIIYESVRTYDSSILKTTESSRKKWLWSGIIVIAVFSLLLRIYKLESIPWGINNDAAWNGMFARRFLDGEPFTIFTPEAWGKETLYMYLIALSFKLFGVSKFTLYLPCILAGTGTSVLVFLLFRKVFHDRLAFISALIYSSMAWNLVFARTGYRCILSPLCLALTGFFYYLAIDTDNPRRKILYFIVCGFSIGIGLNTYFAFRGIPFLIIVIGIHTWMTTPHFMKKNGRGLLFLLITVIMVFAPLALYAFQHMDVFMGRSNFLFIGNKISQTGSLHPLWENISTNLLTLYYKAKVGNFFYHEIPIISRILGFFVTIGFAYHIRYILKRGPFFVMLSFGFGMFPAVLSAPDAARAFLTTISLSILGATGILSIATFVSTLKIKNLFNVLVVCGCAWIIFSECYLYYVTLANNWYAQFGYARKHTLIGYKGLELSKDHQIYISQGHFLDTPKFICYDLPGDVFGITGGEELHYVSDARLMKNLQYILHTPVPENKGLAFVFENEFKNIPLFYEVKTYYPHGIRTDFTDYRYGDKVLFYTYVIPLEEIYSNKR